MQVLAQSSAHNDEGRTRQDAEFNQQFLEFTDQLLATYPDELSNIWVDAAQPQLAHIEFVVALPAAIDSALGNGFYWTQIKEKWPLLDKTSVVITDDGLFNRKERMEIASATCNRLVDNGYKNTICYFSTNTNTLVVEFKVNAESENTVDREKEIENTVKIELSDFLYSHSNFIERDRSVIEIKGISLIDLITISVSITTGDGPVIQH